MVDMKWNTRKKHPSMFERFSLNETKLTESPIQQFPLQPDILGHHETSFKSERW